MIIIDSNHSGKKIGAKAQNLFQLQTLGIVVPPFVVIPEEELQQILDAHPGKDPVEVIEQIRIPEGWEEELRRKLPKIELFAVRSSAGIEDGIQHSFAGQFESYLNVPVSEVAVHIKKVWKSAFSQRVRSYLENKRLGDDWSIAVIIQAMVPADKSGVAFGANPVSGDREEKVLNAVYGLGEGLVSGALDADTYNVRKEQIKFRIAHKTHQLILDPKDQEGTIQADVPAALRDQPVLRKEQIFEIARLLEKLLAHYGTEQDIEFAYFEDRLFLFQSRPITHLKITENYIVWDNSNIIESYPGVTTPLTFSFIRRSYEGAYRLFSSYLGVSDQVIRENEKVYAHTLGLLNGRVYYNLRSWYQMLAMLPGYSINARFMERMMGVKEKFDVPEHFRLSKSKAWWRILKMAVKMLSRYVSLPGKRKAFFQLLNRTIAAYKAIDLDKKSAYQLKELYYQFEDTLLKEWKAPLLNDFFAMIWFGMLEKETRKMEIPEQPNIHNDLLCGSADIISVEPIHRSLELSQLITGRERLRTLFTNEDPGTIYKSLQAARDSDSKILFDKIKKYIHDFGERCVGELKLETVSYTQDPTLFIKLLQSYVQNNITLSRTSGDIEETLRKNAEAIIDERTKGSFLRRWWIRKLMANTRSLVSARENLRYERTRAFGIVREIFTHIGYRFAEQKLIGSYRDIFYLTQEEIFSFIEGTAISQDLRYTIENRRKEYAAYEASGPLAERIITYGMVYDGNDFFDASHTEQVDGDLKGIGCCPGIIEARVRVVHHPGEVSSLEGDILVTTSTDPGWVTLFTSASGIIVERGSLLSHSAIVSREMGIPCIVSVTGLLKTLKTGDRIKNGWK
ncbi:MAG: hypothetical protein KL787_11215 [Taibaiella sp.]|nr:hypothetical protein [Taibaiella sp.]